MKLRDKLRVRTALECYHLAQVNEISQAVTEMEKNGFQIDLPYLAEQGAKARAEEEDTLSRLGEWLKGVGWTEELNWASPVQLIRLFHDHLKLPPSPLWKKGRVHLDHGERKLDEAALDWLILRSPDSVLPGLRGLIHLRRVRGIIKYLTKLPDFVAPDGFVHPVYGPSSDFDPRAGTITWRLAAKNPEIQQIPSDPKKDWYRIRRAFIAPANHKVLCADEKALESVILAHLLIVLFNDHSLATAMAPGAPDFHCVNARRVFGDFLGVVVRGRVVTEYPYEFFQSDDWPELQALRQDIKAVWYGLMYFKSSYGFATSLRDASGEPIGEEKAGKIVDALFKAVPGIPKFQNFIRDYAREFKGVPGLAGSWCDLSALYSSGNKWELARAERIGGNFPMQEGGARIIGRAMLDCMSDPWLRGVGVRIERQIHDELDFRVPDSAPMAEVKSAVTRHMTSYPLKSHLQVSVGVGQNWDQC